jgi:hypothetical protein
MYLVYIIVDQIHQVFNELKSGLFLIKRTKERDHYITVINQNVQ